MCFRDDGRVDNYSFGSCQHRRLFPHFYPPNRLGNKFLPLRGFPHTGPGCYITDWYGLAYNLTKIPTSIKGYAIGARTAMRFKPVHKELTLHPGLYQKVKNWKEKPKQNFAPFNTLVPRFQSCLKDPSYPGPGTYNPEKKPLPKVTWPMKFGSPDWAQVPSLEKRTLKAELSTDKEFRKHRNRVAYLSLYYD
uniref:Ciliary microtubule associated protein 3 n=1 Tax=Sciurus vulgaris TaxID=55149 RepID=A0A8D2JN11_SCIVU